MNSLKWIPVICAAFLTGCRSYVPFPEAVQGRIYSLQQFELAIRSEKMAFLEDRNRNSAVEEGGHEDNAVLLRQYPTWSQWEKMKRHAKSGDLIAEFHHRLYGAVFDGPAEADQHGYALVRHGSIESFVSVNDMFPENYLEE